MPMQSSRHAFTMLRCVVVVSLLAVVVASCGSAAPSDLLLPHTVVMSDSDSGVGPAPEAGGPDAIDMPPVEDASPRDVGPPRDASRCDADTCANGCCSSEGRCLLGTDDSACGAGGVACGSCTDLGEMCSQGVCVSTAPPEDAGCDPATCPPGRCFFGSVACCNMMGACSCTRFTLCP